jgi:hypothetical protein
MYQHKDRHIHHTNKTESTQVTHTATFMYFLTREPKIYSGEKTASSTMMLGE